MNGILQRAAEWFDSLDARLPISMVDIWLLYQVVILFVAFGLAVLIARRLEPALEARARAIKGNPDLLRLVVALLRRIRWVAFIVLLWLARLIMLEVTWPSRSALLAIALSLAAAWLFVSVITRIIRNQTLSKVVQYATWVYIALYILGFEEWAVRALDSAAIDIGEMRLSLLLAGKAVLVTVVLVWLAVFVGNLTSNWIDRSEDLSPSFKVLIGKLIKITLILLAGAFALAATGIDLTALTVFSGAVGVGIGFGLQKVVSNFISGIIILLDKSIKPGDTVSVGDTFGWIRELRARFVSVITRDGREYLIPNEDLITQQVVNWSFSSEYVRIDVDFGTAYDSDPHAVSRIAIETAKSIRASVRTPRPSAG